jgi:hypothetical protein
MGLESPTERHRFQSQLGTTPKFPMSMNIISKSENCSLDDECTFSERMNNSNESERARASWNIELFGMITINNAFEDAIENTSITRYPGPQFEHSAAHV